MRNDLAGLSRRVGPISFTSIRPCHLARASHLDGDAQQQLEAVVCRHSLAGFAHASGIDPAVFRVALPGPVALGSLAWFPRFRGRD